MTDNRQRDILNSTLNFAIIATDRNGVVTHWNPGAERVFGWAAQEATGRTAHFFFTPEDRAIGRVETEMHLAITTGGSPDERWHLRRDGSRFWALGELTPMRDEAGQHVGFVKVLREQTVEHEKEIALSEAQAQLRESEDHFRITVNLSPQVNWTSDPNGNIDSYSARWLDLTGQQPGEPDGAGWINVLHPEDVERTLAVFAKSLGSGEPVDVDYRIKVAATNEYRWMRARARPRRDTDGAIIRWYGVIDDVHEQKLAQAELQASEAQFRAFAQAIPNHLWASHPDGNLYWFNEQVYAYSGAEQGSLDGMAWAGIVHLDDVGLAAEQWKRSLDSGTPYETEFRIKRADGEYRWFLVRAEPVTTPIGSITAWIGTNTDIHARKLAEAEEAVDRERLWSLSQELLLVCDFDGIIKTVSPSATRILGWQEDEMVGRLLAEFVHPDDLESTANEVGKLALGATTLAFENRYRHRDGTYRLLSWSAVPDGRRIHAVGRDVTDERAIARDQERSWSISPVIKMIVGRDGIVQGINPGFTRALGWQASSIVGQPVSKFLSQEDQKTSDERRQSLLRGGQLPEYQVGFIAKDGRERRIAWTTIVEEEAIFAFGRDVTVEHEQALALAQSEEALRQSQKMEAVGQLTGGLAHDFNNLLAGISGALELMNTRIQQGRLADVDRYLVAAQGATRRAAALTHRLLAFSRRQTLAPKPTDVNSLVHGMLELIQRTVGPSIQVETATMAGLWTALVDGPQLENALLNLCINARDAMPDGGRITIETANRWIDRQGARQHDIPEGQYLSVCVSDTGTGMTKDVIEKAFDPFFTTKPIGQGTGLGLSMIYGFAKQSAGQVRIYSEVGQGTMVCIYLPRHGGSADRETDVLAETAPPIAESGQTVLVVDDEPTVRMLVVDILEELGYTTVEAADSATGLKILQGQQRIDLLISDVGLPGGMNGRQMADAGRVKRPGLKVLFITGFAENALLNNGQMDAGMAVLTKPFTLEGLQARIGDLIED